MDASVRLGGVNLRAYLLREVSFSEILAALGSVWVLS